MNRSTKYRKVLVIAGLLSALFTWYPDALSATATITPEIQKFTPACTCAYKITLEEGEEIKSGPEVSGDGVTSSGSGTLSFSIPATAKVTWTVQKTDPDDPTSEVTFDVTVSAKAVKVALTPVANGSESPVLSPKICLNAQDVYKKASFKATVLPVGTTATIDAYGGTGIDFSSITPKTNISNDTVITLSGDGTGSYYIILSHDELASCQAQGNGTSFEFKYKKLQPQWDGDSPPNGTWSSFRNSNNKVEAKAAHPSGGDFLDTFKRMKKELGVSKGNHIGKIITAPTEGCYDGPILAHIEVMARQEGFLNCQGVFGVGMVNINGTELSWEGKLNMTGAGINKTIKKQFHAAAPFLVFITDAENIKFTYDLDKENVRLKVNQEIKTGISVELSGQGTGIGQGIELAAYTNYNPLSLSAKGKFLKIKMTQPFFSEFKIVE